MALGSAGVTRQETMRSSSKIRFAVKLQTEKYRSDAKLKVLRRAKRD